MGIFDYLNAPATGGVLGAVQGYQPPSRMDVLAAGMKDLAMNMQGLPGNALTQVQQTDARERQNQMERERLKRKETAQEEDRRLRRLAAERDSATAQATQALFAQAMGMPLAAPAGSPMAPPPPGPLAMPPGTPPMDAQGDIDVDAAITQGFRPMEENGQLVWYPPEDTAPSIPRPPSAPVAAPAPVPQGHVSPPLGSRLPQDAGMYSQAAQQVAPASMDANLKLRKEARATEAHQKEMAEHRDAFQRGLAIRDSLPEGSEDRAMAESYLQRLSDTADTRTPLQKEQEYRASLPPGPLRDEADAIIKLKTTEKLKDKKGSSLVIGADGQLAAGGGEGELTTAMQSNLQKSLFSSARGLGQLDMIKQEIRPEHFQMGPKLAAQVGAIMEKVNLGNLTQEDLDMIREHSAGAAAVATYVNRIRHELYGSALTPLEKEAAYQQLPHFGANFWEGDSYSQFRSKMDIIERDLRLSHARALLATEGQDLSKIPRTEDHLIELVEEQGRQLEAQAIVEGMPPAEAEAAARRAVRLKFGHLLRHPTKR